MQRQWTASPHQRQHVYILLKRLYRWTQLDFEVALWQLTYLCIAPKRV